MIKKKLMNFEKCFFKRHKIDKVQIEVKNSLFKKETAVKPELE